MCVLAIFFIMVSSHRTPNCSAVIHLPHDKLKNSAFVGNSGHFDIEVKLTVDEKMAKLHIFSLGPAVVRRLPGRSVPGQRRTKYPRCVLGKWLCRVCVGLKIHAESSSNGSSRPASHIKGRAKTVLDNVVKLCGGYLCSGTLRRCRTCATSRICINARAPL